VLGIHTARRKGVEKMKIRLAAISLDNLPQAHPLIDTLRNAVNAGDMNSIDTATDKLLALTNMEHLVDLSEEEWQKFLADTRTRNPAFKSDYLISGEVCSQIFPNITSKMMVLQLPFDEKGEDDV
jgi:hypothetical protein